MGRGGSPTPIAMMHMSVEQGFLARLPGLCVADTLLHETFLSTPRGCGTCLKDVMADHDRNVGRRGVSCVQVLVSQHGIFQTICDISGRQDGSCVHAHE